MLLTNTVTFTNTALVAVLTYRLTGKTHLIHERFTYAQRDTLQSRIDVIRPYQSKDAKGNWITGKFDKEGLVDYMFVGFEEPSDKPAFSVSFAK